MRPHTTVILAISLDGKIADYQRNPARFVSEIDKAHLEHQISLMDAVLFGAETLRAYRTSLSITNPSLLENRLAQNKPPQPIHIVCSGSGKLNPEWRFFQQPFPRWLLTTEEGKQYWNELNAQGFERILSLETDNIGINWSRTFKQLLKLKIQRIGILGGGKLVATLLEENLIDEWQITLCPVILGGENAPTLVEGKGFIAKNAHKLQLITVKTINQEIFLHYRQEK